LINFNDIGKVLSEIKEITDFVIIGDTVVDLCLKRKGTESDVDLFPLSISVITESDAIRELALDKGWDFGSTPLDTPRLIIPINEEQLQVDFYENFQDFYVPTEIINNAVERKIGNDIFKVIKLEDYILLKANAYREEDEDELKTLLYLLGEGKITIDKEYLRKHADLFEENSKSIKARLNMIGFKI
jgi:predicted nucleotidyltransferase